MQSLLLETQKTRLRSITRTNWELVRPYGRWLYYGLFPGRRPDYFNAAWMNPSYRLGRDPLPGWNHRVENHKTFIFFPLADWHARMQRSQHLAKALADAGHLCIYVNPHLGLEYKTPPLFSPRARVSMLHPGILELHIHLPAEHAFNARCITSAEAAIIVRAIEELVADLGVREVIQIASLPSWLAVVRALRIRRGYRVVYDCHDYLSGFTRLAREIVDLEPLLLEHCDQVMFSAQYLMDLHIGQSPALAPKASLLRNANDPADFLAESVHDRDRVRPTVGYAGSLDYWFDVELLEQTAATQPHLDFILAGRIEDDRVRRLESSPNVRFTGEIPYSAIPKFLGGCDAAMIPFSRLPLTLATNPIKMYEYFGAGLPVVSTRLPEVELYRDLVYIADTAEEFGCLLSNAVREKGSFMRQRRLKTAQCESWCKRAETLLENVSMGRDKLIRFGGTGYTPMVRNWNGGGVTTVGLT